MKKPELSIIMPCYNESRNLPIIVERLAAFWPAVNFELILVNNGSRDDSERVLQELAAKGTGFLRTVRIETNKGYGHGVLTGLKAARADLVAYSHADIQTPPEDVIRAFQLAKENGLDLRQALVKGERINRRKEEQATTKGLEMIAFWLLGYRVFDMNGQPKLFHRDLLQSLKDAPDDFSFDVYVMYKAVQKGLKVVTFPVDFGLRLHGQSHWASSRIKKVKTIAGYIKNILMMSLRDLPDNNNPIKQLFKFCIVGVCGAAINYGIFYALYAGIHLYYVVASLFGYLLAGAAIFLFNRQWTFAVRQGKPSGQFIRYMLLIGGSFLANGLSIYIFTDLVNIRAEFSQLLTMAITTAINFVGAKLWVFKPDREIKYG